MPLKPDEIILNGKYRIVEQIGEGGMARVWLAEELTFENRKVAIKEPRDDVFPIDLLDLQRRYAQEVRVCAALEKAHAPHIVRALTAEPYGNGVLLVREYMPGGDLAGLIRQYPRGLPEDRVFAITWDLLAALERVHAHELEIVHRDIKPSNVLFDGGGRAHLGDFGLAQGAGSSGRSDLRGGLQPGTLLYMAPEQQSDPGYLRRSADLCALGCVLFEILTGKRYKRVKPSAPLSELRPNVSPWWDTVLAKALLEDQREWYQSAGEFAESLKQASGTERTRGEAETGTRRETEARTRRKEEENAMGGNDGDADVRPAHSVTLDGFWMDKYEVTNAQYRKCVGASACAASSYADDPTYNGARQPAVGVDWDEAINYCQWAEGRLPTEVEWEYAPRGETGGDTLGGTRNQRRSCAISLAKLARRRRSGSTHHEGTTRSGSRTWRETYGNGSRTPVLSSNSFCAVVLGSIHPPSDAARLRPFGTRFAQLATMAFDALGTSDTWHVRCQLVTGFVFPLCGVEGSSASSGGTQARANISPRGAKRDGRTELNVSVPEQ